MIPLPIYRLYRFDSIPFNSKGLQSEPSLLSHPQPLILSSPIYQNEISKLIIHLKTANCPLVRCNYLRPNTSPIQALCSNPRKVSTTHHITKQRSLDSERAAEGDTKEVGKSGSVALNKRGWEGNRIKRILAVHTRNSCSTSHSMEPALAVWPPTHRMSCGVSVISAAFSSGSLSFTVSSSSSASSSLPWTTSSVYSLTEYRVW